MAYWESNGHMTDDISEVLIVTSVCLGAREALSKKVTALDRLRVRMNVILLKQQVTMLVSKQMSYIALK